jgi:hypothetical protein
MHGRTVLASLVQRARWRKIRMSGKAWAMPKGRLAWQVRNL